MLGTLQQGSALLKSLLQRCSREALLPEQLLLCQQGTECRESGHQAERTWSLLGRSH